MEKFSSVLVTGGAGFIGSRLVDRLMRMDCFVRVVDNLSGGSLDNVRVWVDSRRFEFVRGDLKDLGVAEKAVDGVEVVFHLAANPEVRVAEVDPSILALRHFLDEKKKVDVYNVGSLDKVDVKRIAEIVSGEMGLQDLEFRFTGGVDGGRGWRGDVKTMLLSADKLVNLGWRPRFSSEEAVRLGCRELLRSIDKA